MVELNNDVADDNNNVIELKETEEVNNLIDEFNSNIKINSKRESVSFRYRLYSLTRIS
jgi:oligoribonuclease NrnB/cAMP/cGMP phosphodiesterase (DHH superfamily)